jgi:hypothetical protein
MILLELLDSPVEYELEKLSQGYYVGYFTVKGVRYEFAARDTTPYSEEAEQFLEQKYGKRIDPYSPDPEDRERAIKAYKEHPTYIISFNTAVPSRGKADRNSFGIQGTGNQYAVFSTVMRMIADVVQRENPIELQFDAEEPSRVKLYDRMVKNFASKMGFENVAIPLVNSTQDYILFNTQYR